MQVGQFPASAANALIEGYCDDFVALASVLAQTLEQVSMRSIKLDRSKQHLERIERGMREMAEAIGELLQRGVVSTEFEVALGRPKKEPALDAPATALAATDQVPPAVRQPTTSATTPPPKPRPTPPAPANPPAKATAAATPAAATPPPKPPAPAAPPRPTGPLAHLQPPAGTRSAAAKRSAPTPTPTPTPTSTPNPATTPPATAPAAVRPEPLRASPLLAKFESLEKERKSGTLYVQAGAETLAFEFVDGCITQACSDGVLADERLGDLLVELGSCTREQLAAAFAGLAPDDLALLGERLVRSGAVTNSQVVVALEHQVQRRLRRACAHPQTTFDFADGELMADDGRVRVAPSALRKALGTSR